MEKDASIGGINTNLLDLLHLKSQKAHMVDLVDHIEMIHLEAVLNTDLVLKVKLQQCNMFANTIYHFLEFVWVCKWQLLNLHAMSST